MPICLSGSYLILLNVAAGLHGLVNFEHRPWWYLGHFCKKAGKNLEKKIISKEII
jgi:hypothetical protein